MERTLVLIKPDSVERKIVGKIISHIEDAGFGIVNMRMVHLTRDEVEDFYSIHKNKEFFLRLIDFVTRGKIIALLLEGKDVVKRTRLLVGKTDPEEAEKGTIRATYGLSKTENVVHASDSSETARREIEFFFG
ncbi:nucleoside-diphosphate kinase [candidate division WOR-3 bacterium]|nr:nucleoside-diphosphate kinase [candidate division WOR-3 bacterium]